MTVEDCLESLVSFSEPRFDLDPRHVNVLHSLSTQIAKGTALTDRQHSMLKRILSEYKDQFAQREIDLDQCVDNLRTPLRSIDRSKYITIVDNEIKIRFPFNKKTICAIHDLKYLLGEDHYRHKNGTHEHFFTYNERCLYFVVNRFLNNEFEIDESVLNNYKVLETMFNQQHLYMPGIYDFKIQNCSDTAVKYMVNELGEPDKDNLALYQDRSMLYGLHHLDELAVNRSLASYSILARGIAKRKNPNVHINCEKWHFEWVLSALLELDRLPLLIVLDNKLESFRYDADVMQMKDTFMTQLLHTHKCVKNIVEPHEISASELLEAQQDFDRYSDYVKSNGLNNPVTKDTKIIYTTMERALAGFVDVKWNYLTVIYDQGCSRRAYALKSRVKHSDLSVYYDTSSPFLIGHTTSVGSD